MELISAIIFSVKYILRLENKSFDSENEASNLNCFKKLEPKLLKTKLWFVTKLRFYRQGTYLTNKGIALMAFRRFYIKFLV